MILLYPLFVLAAYIAFLYVIVSDTLPGHMAPQGTGLVMLAVGLANLTGMPLTGRIIYVLTLRVLKSTIVKVAIVFSCCDGLI